MTADVELLPLPEGDLAGEMRWGAQVYGRDEMHAYARACVAHATAAKDAEIEALRAEVDFRDSVIATHAADTREYQKRISQAEARADKLQAEVETGHYNWNRFMEPITSYFVYKPGFVIRPESAREDEGGPYASHPCGAAKNIMCYVDALEARADKLAEALREAYRQVRELCDCYGHVYPEASFVRYEALLREQEEGHEQ